MATVPGTRTWVAGEVVTDAFMNDNITAVLNFLLAPPIFKGYQASAQSFTNDTYAPVTLDSELVDSAGGHSTVTNTSRYAAVYAGWYAKGGGCAFAANATGRRLARVMVNGSAVTGTLSGQPANSSVIGWAYRSDRIFLNVGDYVEDAALQNSGSSLSTFTTNAEFQCSMTLTWDRN